MTEREKAEFDQATAFTADNMPQLWKRLYVNLQEVSGFTESQAFTLLQTYILATHAIYGVRGIK
jgi:hypothetical protein